ncbi:hypothetical protein CPC08DRAFT_550822 [Agrocybe pediades]|nr:hypothetical protein CPC08DRAFT_550822 [Agrocybe pediades]
MNHQAPAALRLPSELKHLIAQHLPNESLAALARTHSTFQNDVEYVLYRRLEIDTSKIWSRTSAETISKSPLKASYVRYLSFDSRDTWPTRNPNIVEESMVRRIFGHVLLALEEHECPLWELRVLLDPHRGEEWLSQVRRLEKILRTGKFVSLRILYCNTGLDIFQVAKECPQLRVYAVSTSGSGDMLPLLESLKKLRDHPKTSRLPTTFAMGWTWSNSWDRISIFSAFYPVEQYTSIWQDIQTSLKIKTGDVKELSIYLRDIRDISSVRGLIKNMLDIFPAIQNLNFYAHVTHDLSLEMKKMATFSFSRLLPTVSFYSWPQQEISRNGKTIEKAVFLKRFVLQYSLQE